MCRYRGLCLRAGQWGNYAEGENPGAAMAVGRGPREGRVARRARRREAMRLKRLAQLEERQVRVSPSCERRRVARASPLAWLAWPLEPPGLRNSALEASGLVGLKHAQARKLMVREAMARLEATLQQQQQQQQGEESTDDDDDDVESIPGTYSARDEPSARASSAAAAV